MPPLPDTFDSGCRTDLLIVDDVPVPMRISGDTDLAVERGRLDVTACAGAPLSVDLDAGEHLLRTGVGRDTGFDLDRLALSSAAGGAEAVAPLAADDTVEPGPPTRVIDRGPVSFDIEVDTSGEPFWLSVGQSWNEGWQATIDGEDLGAPQVINGYGNGWLIEPDQAGTLAVSVEWTPQRTVWAFVAVSALGVLVCLALALFARRPPPGRRSVADPDPSLDPELVLPWEQTGPTAGRRPALLAAAGLTVFAFLNLSFAGWLPGLALVVGALSFAAFRSPRGRSLLALAAVGALGLSYAYVVFSQIRHEHVPDFIWPRQFERVHVLAIVAVLLLLGEAIRELLVHGRRRPAGDPTDAPCRCARWGRTAATAYDLTRHG